MKTNKILIAVGILLLLLGLRGLYKTAKGLDDEKIWYVDNLKYNFTATVDSIGAGTVFCKVKSGICKMSTEDSLNRHLNKYKYIRFLKFQKDGRVKIRPVPPNFEKFRVYDSIIVNSSTDAFNLVRNGKTIVNSRILYSLQFSNALTFGLPDTDQ